MGAGDPHSEGCRETWGQLIPVLKWREVGTCWSDLAHEAARDAWAPHLRPSAGQNSFPSLGFLVNSTALCNWEKLLLNICAGTVRSEPAAGAVSACAAGALMCGWFTGLARASLQMLLVGGVVGPTLMCHEGGQHPPRLCQKQPPLETPGASSPGLARWPPCVPLRRKAPGGRWGGGLRHFPPSHQHVQGRGMAMPVRSSSTRAEGAEGLGAGGTGQAEPQGQGFALQARRGPGDRNLWP